MPLIEKFESGFIAGVKAVNPNATVEVQYAGAFDKADKGKAIASSMYASGIDIIYHAAGGTGNGVFSEAIDLKNKIRTKKFGSLVLTATNMKKEKCLEQIKA